MEERDEPPHVIVLAGPNGAGKSTAAPKVLPHLLGVGQFVNADVIAQGLSAFAPEGQAIEAGRIMLRRLHALAEARETFALETTLASRSLAPWIRGLARSGYRFDLLFFYLGSPELAVERVAARVRSGGHHVPAETIARRYRRGLHNLFHLYIPLAGYWAVYDNTVVGSPRRIASGTDSGAAQVTDADLWNSIRKEYADAPDDERKD